MVYHVYMLRCVDGSLYTGYTKNLDSRVRLHMSGKGARYTRVHRPRKLVYSESFKSRSEALRRERAIKRLSRREKLALARSRSK